MKNMMQRIRNRKGFTLVELMIVVAIIGILAAIAIPAFLRSVKKSKTSEADGIMKKMAEGSKGYFTSEQRGSQGVASSGEPWHAATRAGFPVTWNGYVFPGGGLVPALNSWAVDAGTAIGDCTAAPIGGSKFVPYGAGGAVADPPDPGTPTNATINKFGVDFADPMYFTYSYETLGTGGNATATVSARANFDGGTAECHTVSQRIEVGDGAGGGSQEVVIVPATTAFEFE